VSNSIKTQDQAQVYCHALREELVKINSTEENEFVLIMVNEQAPTLKHVWIGLNWDSSLISQFQCTLTGLLMNQMDLTRNRAATCTLPGTEALQGTGMTFLVELFQIGPAVSSARSFPS